MIGHQGKNEEEGDPVENIHTEWYGRERLKRRRLGRLKFVEPKDDKKSKKKKTLFFNINENAKAASEFI